MTDKISEPDKIAPPVYQPPKETWRDKYWKYVIALGVGVIVALLFILPGYTGMKMTMYNDQQTYCDRDGFDCYDTKIEKVANNGDITVKLSDANNNLQDAILHMNGYNSGWKVGNAVRLVFSDTDDTHFKVWISSKTLLAWALFIHLISYDGGYCMKVGSPPQEINCDEVKW